MVLVADPQLVDPHTYPGRPWPLSTITVRHTDQYLRRSFTSIRKVLSPETVFFLGDLFDGGREWSTSTSKSPFKEWNKYTGDFWLNEYDRFGRVFLKPWNTASASDVPGRTRRMIMSLPGNHDLGFGNGIQLPVRDRFQTFFGDGNRIDVIGNHTFVSVDTVSLSAKMQPVDSGALRNPAIWKTAEDFLATVKDRKVKALGRALRVDQGKPENPLGNHTVFDINHSEAGDHDNAVPSGVDPNMPTILLTHVPLYRKEGTPCGPKRERWPPSRIGTAADPVESDDRNAISVHAGIQYQNVLHPDVSKQLIEQIGEVEHVFSGDDHDYCEVVHRRFTSRGGGIREITVKSLSWAMGVRKPGFLMVSLYNPIDEHGASLQRGPGQPASTSIQSHLCLMPDQLGIFIFYGEIIALTALILIARAWKIAFRPSKRDREGGSVPLLPLSSPPTPTPEKIDHDHSHSCSSSSNSSEGAYLNGLAPRSNAGRARGASPVPSYGYGLPPSNGNLLSPEPLAPSSDSRSFPSYRPDFNSGVPRPRKQGRAKFIHEAAWSFFHVAIFALACYTWLMYTV